MKHSVACVLVFALASLGARAHAPGRADAPGIALHEPLPGLFTAGQPAATDWQAIHARGVRTVINLRLPGEMAGRDEAAEVRAAGMRYVSIPVAGADGINAGNARALHEALAPDHERVLVHCASGNRAGALLGLEQADFDGVAKDAALRLAREAGTTSLEAKTRQALGLGE